MASLCQRDNTGLDVCPWQCTSVRPWKRAKAAVAPLKPPASRGEEDAVLAASHAPVGLRKLCNRL